jgi:hypothetical protein
VKSEWLHQHRQLHSHGLGQFAGRVPI